jgi:glycosyltransferase involved in cell wall biosynthesis
MPQLEKLTIIHVDTGREWRGGQNQALLLCKGLSRVEGVVQTLVCQPRSPLSERAAKDGVDVVDLSMRGEWDLGAAWRLRRLIRVRGAGLVHAHDAHAHALGWMATTGLTDVSLVAARRVDFEVSRSPFSRRKCLSPRVHYLAISNGVRDVLLRGGVAADRISVVASGVDPERFSFRVPRGTMRRELGIAGEAPVVGTVGSLVDHKGHRYLIDAAPLVLERFPSAEFVIVGEGKLRRDLERRIREKKLERKIHLAGYRRDMETFLSSFDVFALSSHLEGLCTSVIDAMLFRLPIVGTRTGGVPDLVRDGETGLLVEPKDPGALARAIVRLLANQELGSRLGTAARKRALGYFTSGAMVEGTLQAYRRILAGRSSS